jgi:M6 family metalloprotease-like protein
VLILVALIAAPLVAAEPSKTPDLSEYKTVATAIPAKDTKPTNVSTTERGYLGIHVNTNAAGKQTVGQIASDSPAARAGVNVGDELLKFDGKVISSPETFGELLRAKKPGDTIQLSVSRGNKPMEIRATLTSVSRPQKPGPQRATLGVDVESRKDAEGVVIKQVASGSAAERARLKVDEVLLKIDDTAVTGPEKLREVLSTKKPDDNVTVTLLLADKQVEMKMQLGGESAERPRGFGGGPGGGGGGRGGFDARQMQYWKKDNYKLAIVIIDYPDVKHNPKVPAKAWDDAMFSKGTYKTTATGQTAYGSLYDYYLEQSYGHLKVSGKAFAPIEVSKKRAEYGVQGANRTALLTEALDKILARDGKDALKDFDGVIYIYSGGRMNVARGSLYWPHRSSVSHNGKRWPYFICGEGGERMGNISVYAHEFGHMLGMPDLYARPENPGSEGLAIWCAMSNQAGNGRPQHFSAWCKEKLGWITPTTIDPMVPQKLILSPIEDSKKECFKVLLRPDGSEYLLLENRCRKGFDASLPAEGLLIWRVVGNRPILEESHGVEGPSGPRVFNSSVPYPSAANDAFTPYTTPSSRAQLGGGLPVFITNIRRVGDGRITFQIGYEYQ